MKNIFYASIACAMFFAAAALLNGFSLWSAVGNFSIPWVLSCIGIAIGLLGIHTWFEERDLSPIWHIFLFLGIITISSIAVVVDKHTYGSILNATISDGLLEIAGFACIYALLLFPAFIVRKSCSKSV